MNYCTKCSSYYQQAGTCNCFAPSVIRTYPSHVVPGILPYPNVTIWGNNNGAATPLVIKHTNLLTNVAAAGAQGTTTFKFNQIQ